VDRAARVSKRIRSLTVAALINRFFMRLGALKAHEQLFRE
jgi:hypothetical protein